MQKISILLVISFFVYIDNTKSQGYIPFPDSNAVWIIQQDDGGPGPDWYYKYYTEGDTLINSYIYTKIFYDNWEMYAGAYRSDTNGITYYIPADSTNEYIIRDFSKNVGDTIKNVIYDFPPYYGFGYIIDFYVDSINYTYAGPYLLKRLYLSNNNVLDSIYPDYIYNRTPLIWIEKIGCLLGGFYNNARIGLGGCWLYCMNYNDTTYFSATYPEDSSYVYTYDQCVIPDGLNEINKINSEIRINPNPFSNFITLTNIGNFFFLNTESTTLLAN